MSIVTADTDRWQVSTRAHGEVLASRASVGGLELLLLGEVEGYSTQELTSWLQSLAQAVSDDLAESPPGDPVPPLLRESLGGLLFSRAELWNRGLTPCAVALVAGQGRIGFGWVGEATVEVFRDGARDDSEWVSIRDAQGREARAWCGSPDHDVRIEFSVAPALGVAAVALEARWTAAARRDAAEHIEAVHGAAESLAEIERPGPPDSSAPVGELASPAEGSPSSGVARWLAQHLRWNRPEEGAGAPEPASSEPVLETPTTAHGEADMPSSAESRRVEDMVQALASEINQRLESRDAIEVGEMRDAAEGLDETRAPESAAGPDLIPPTPEPESLTAATVSLPLETPSGVDASSLEAPFMQPESAAEPGARARRPPARRPEWPDVPPSEAPDIERNWKPLVLWGALVLALFGIGWLVGSMQEQSGPEQVRRPSSFVLFLRRIGLAPPRYEVAVTSRPPAAWIALDGKELSVRTPATLELPPGEHRVELSFPDVGSAPYLVRGGKNDRVSLDASMWGALDVVPSEPRAVVSVAVDGQPLGFVPIHLDSVAPGPHDLRFSSPGIGSWGSTIEVRVGETREVLAYPLQSPATGLLQVRAMQNAEGESAPVDGAHVWVDGQARGVTPLTLELPRGPHSVRVTYQRDEAPIQVIDLPGGNQRFATFEFGLRSDLPSLVLKAPAVFTMDEPALVSATLNEIGAADVKEMWLHVRTPESHWRRYPMTLLDAQGSVVGAAPFPIALLGDDGRQLYYVSALTAQGDEIFTEMQTAQGPAKTRR